jgi:hypothetical protein
MATGLEKTAVNPHTMQPANALAPTPVNSLAQTALNPLAQAYQAYQQYVGQPFQQAIRGGIRGYFGLPMMTDANTLGREAYGQGVALSNMPGIGAPAGAAKMAAATMLPAAKFATKALSKEKPITVWHGSPAGPIVGTPRTGPHDETGIMSFSVGRYKETAENYAEDVLKRRWNVTEPNPSVTEFKLYGKVEEYGKFLRDAERYYKLGPNDDLTFDMMLEYAKKHNISGVDQAKNLGIDEISVLLPEFLVPVAK